MRRISSIAMLLLSGAAWLRAQEGGGMPEPSAGWKWANFVLLVVGLGYLIAKTLPPLFKSRTEEIQKGIAEARAIKQDADKRAAEVDARTATLGADIERFRVEAKAEMQQEGERIRQETAGQIARLENQAQQEIEISGKIARRELKSYAAKLSLDLAEQRVRERLTPKTEQELVDAFIQDLERRDLERESKS
jgi:F-type H+-transporting ATPase subunit b